MFNAATNNVPHPEVVVDRLERAAGPNGDPHRILAGADSSFDTSSGIDRLADNVAWGKLKSPRKGLVVAIILLSIAAPGHAATDLAPLTWHVSPQGP